MPFLSAPERDIEIHYDDKGAGAPVVLIGGLTSTVETWSRQIDALAEQFRVIAPDNRGSGQTRMPNDDGIRTPSRWAGDVCALIDGLGLERVHLVGASMGGAIAQAFAVEHPTRLRTLTLMCTFPGGAHGVAVDTELLKGIVAGSLPDASEADFEALAEAALHPDTRVKNPGAWEAFRATKGLWPHSLAEIQRRGGGLAGFSAWDELPALTVPTLVLTGDGDRLVPPENSRLLAARIPGAELHIVEGGGHVFFVEQARAVNELLADFFNRH